jgi:glucan phosphorylase
LSETFPALSYLVLLGTFHAILFNFIRYIADFSTIAMSFRNYAVPYAVDERYSKKVAYFSMEFAVHQPLKIYSGGLGFLAGSHLRSAYELKQNMINIGILWKYGYYDQARNQDQTLQVTWMEKQYSFLEDTGILFQVTIHDHPVWVKVWYLNPETFKSAPLFLMSRRTTMSPRRSRTDSMTLMSRQRWRSSSYWG